MIFCRCIACGKEAEITSVRPIPDGWGAFTAAHWPAGTDMGALYLRICGGCLDGIIGRKPQPVLHLSILANGWLIGIAGPARGGKPLEYDAVAICGAVVRPPNARRYELAPGTTSMMASRIEQEIPPDLRGWEICPACWRALEQKLKEFDFEVNRNTQGDEQ